VRAVAGARYHVARDALVIACDKHSEAGLNRREALEQLVALVREATALSEKFGDFPPVVHLPRYSA
jgi:hypothetical protein